MQRSVILRAFVVSPGHDFKGRHGMPREHHPVVEPREVHCVAGQGIEGDRYFGRGAEALGQITFFDWAVLQDVQAHFALPELSPTVFRRNVLIEGVELPALIGRTFALRSASGSPGVRFAGSQDCAPCYWMDQAVAPGALAFLEGRGGLRARILSDGTLRAGPAEFELET